MYEDGGLPATLGAGIWQRKSRWT